MQIMMKSIPARASVWTAPRLLTSQTSVPRATLPAPSDCFSVLSRMVFPPAGRLFCAVDGRVKKS